MRQDNVPAGTTLEVRCCVAGGGPAGMMLGFLLARAGVDVLVLEKHGDFLRDFRGDTVHPSTLEVMHELGLLDEFLKRPHQEARQLTGYVGGEQVTVADFSHLPTRCRFIAFMPQWDFLNFLAEQGRRYPALHVKMRAQVTGLVEEGGQVVGVRAQTPDGPLEVRAELVVGADGRHSTVREQAGLQVEDVGAPIDVLWMRLPRRPGDPSQPAGRFDRGRILVMIDRGDYWQCGFVIPKGAFEDIRRRGLESFRAEIAAIAPFVQDRVGELRDWDEVKLLTVVVDRLRRWYRPGLLCIGDAAHAMSPVGGVGINLAVQDAVAAANLLADKLREGRVTVRDLQDVQRRREPPTRLTQRAQVFIQDRIISRVLGARRQIGLPLPLRLLRWFPVLRRIPARLIGIGVRPEHVRSAVERRADALAGIHS
jgi:2-polyprenyl-6-methoxyphenol hydroxylase-like FAD-dependent oxidoreductase